MMSNSGSKPLQNNPLQSHRSSTWIILRQVVRENRGLILRLAVMAILILLYDMIDWRILQKFFRLALSIGLTVLGHQTETIDAGSLVVLSVDSRIFSITANCTYAYLFLLLAPFGWRTRERVIKNICNLLALAAALMCLNVIRATFAVHFNVQGIAWAYSHMLPHLLINIVVIIVLLSIAFRQERTCPPG